MIDPVTLTIRHDDRAVQITRPQSTSDAPSFFALGLPKAGSTLLDKLVTGVCQTKNIPTFSFDAECRKLGLKPRDIPATALDLFSETGFGFTGFRSIPVAGLPDWASGRSVALVRDPRDMVVSLFFSLGFSHTPPSDAAGDANRAAFEQERARAKQTDIDTWVLDKAGNTAGLFNRLIKATRQHDIRVWRYEDVIFEKMRWMQEMLDHLGIECAEDDIAKIVRSADIVPDSEDPNKHIRKVTPGDHIDKLKPETISELNKIFERVLSTFNYS